MTRHERGDEVAVHVGGSFTYQPGDERRPLLLLAGGVGINPLLSILQHCCELAGFGGNGSSSGGSCNAAGQKGSPLQQPCAAGHGSSQGPGIYPKLQPPHAAVLYSASVPAELAFRAQLEQLQHWAGSRVRLQLHATAPEWQGREAEWGGRWGRIDTSDLRHALRWLEQGSSTCGEQAQEAGPAHPGQEDGSRSGSSAQPAVPPDLAVLLCGPAAMEDAMIGKLQALGVTQQQIRFKRWW